MSTTKQAIYDLLDGIPESQLTENQTLKDLELASESSTDFWDNAIDDEVWNNV